MKTIRIVGQALIDAEDTAAAKEAAQFILEWDGNSEEDREPLQVEVSPEWDAENQRESNRYEVRECWGSKVSRATDSGDVVATLDTEAEAEAYAAKHNAEALESIAEGRDYELPTEIESIEFNGCERGQYPQSRKATITATLPDGDEITVTGFGQVRFVRDSHSNEALECAVERLIEALKART